MIDGWFETLRCNIYVTELVCNEIYSIPNSILSVTDQQQIAFEILNVLFSYNSVEQQAMQAQIAYLYANNMVKAVNSLDGEINEAKTFVKMLSSCLRQGSKKSLNQTTQPASKL